MAEKEIQPEKCLKKGVRFGKDEEIPYEPTFEGGYAYTAVKATKLNENKNRRRTLELILKPDTFSVNFIPENPAELSTSLFSVFEFLADDFDIGKLGFEYIFYCTPFATLSLPSYLLNLV